MSQADSVDLLGDTVGYLLTRTAITLERRLNASLQPLGLTVAQHACLAMLERSPGLSSAELARGAMVSRQSMNAVLRGLQDRDLVRRTPTAPHGRSRPTRLTRRGRAALRTSTATVLATEEQMVAGLTPPARKVLRDELLVCLSALRHESDAEDR